MTMRRMMKVREEISVGLEKNAGSKLRSPSMRFVFNHMIDIDIPKCHV